MPMHQVVSPANIAGRYSRCWSAVPYAISVGPICRSANHMAAMGAPAAIISSATITRSIGGRSRPPCSAGHPIPIQPSAAMTAANSFENPLIHESLQRPKRATPSAATRAGAGAERFQLGVEHEVHQPAGRAQASISTLAPIGSSATATADRAGRWSPNSAV